MLENLGDSTFSVIINKSTDLSTTKILAIAVKCYCNVSYSVKTRFLVIVDIQGETAHDLFVALSSALTERGFDLKT